MTEQEMEEFQAAENRRYAMMAQGYTPAQKAAMDAFIAKNAQKWALPTSGNLAHDDYRRSREAFGKAAQGGITGYTPTTPGTGWGESYSGDIPGQAIYGNKVGDEALWDQDWFRSLSPQQQAEQAYLADAHSDKIKGRMRLAALAAFGGIAGAGMLGAGMLGSGAMSGAGSLGAAGGDLGMAGWMGAGAGEMGLAPGAAGLASSGGGMGALSALEGADMAGGLLPQFGSSGAYSSGLGMTNAGMGAIGDMIKQYGPDVLKLFGGGQGNQSGGGLLGNLGAAGAGILQNYYNNATMPGIPDYMKLANMTGMSANPNQTNAQGDTSTWTIDPITGQRTQQVKYGQANQEAFDEQQAIMKALRNKVQLPQAALPPMQQFNPSSLQQVNPNAVWG